MSFDKIIQRLLDAEGGFVDHPDDKGGPTNFGITQSTLESYRGKPVTADDVRVLKVEDAKAIYKAKYWTPMGLDSVHHEHVRLVLFDQGVNRGTKTAVIQMQSTLNRLGAKLTLDGVLGPVTAGKINSGRHLDICREYLQASEHAYVDIVKRNPSQIVFLSGWLNRVHKLQDIIFAGIDAKLEPVPAPQGEPAPVVVPEPGEPAPQYWRPHPYHPMFKVPAPYTHLHPYDFLMKFKGEKEISGSRDNPLIAHMHEHSGNLGTHSDSKNDYHDEVPHCSSALQWVADGCGCEKTGNALASSWDNYVGQKLKEGDWVEVGDIVRIAHPGGHVTLCNKRFQWIDGRSFEGFGSNQGNSIKVSSYSTSHIKSVHKWKPKPGTKLAPIGTKFEGNVADGNKESTR